ncbi:MAG: tRNA uridine-5-carboxymethylaminomethyl(34) synthesis enzyme MnmG [Phycisphaeraceae bacterium]|nr:tRNA uridine-5-carboxymethylaminomethyl(34) synthesis enzyme MnmG [Phycisphaeraceae bacterium]
MIRRDFQVIVIGGGHAGVEAAWAAANLLGSSPLGGQGLAAERQATRDLASVALVTIDPATIGVMSCNPAIGGLAKGQLVREIDAMGGLMGLAADATGIQFKVLNSSRGPAVRGPRAQCDKHAYAEEVQRLIASRPEIEVIAGTVERIVVEGGGVRGVVVRPVESATRNAQSSSQKSEFAFCDWSFELSAPAVVLTTGTFMRGLMHTGEMKTPGGRHGEAAAVGISAALRDLGFELGRLKTGTPPRLKRGTIRWDELKEARGDDEPVPFSDLSETSSQGTIGNTGPSGAPRMAERSVAVAFPRLPQVDCRETTTTPEVHDLIRANLHRAPMYSGQIESVGPRYCPSIEDKVVRFAERESHTVFLEPESLRDDWVYCNGISTSLPADIQDRIVRAMPGCENALIHRYGYAVEYDMVRPHQIYATGMTKIVEGLFLAGQINGTSGYEEAAAQGLIAGINAARYARGQGAFTLRRDQAYIGVMMDDLVTKTPVEPYRMFTSRAEHRLLLRPDNAPERLTPIAAELGLLADEHLGRARRERFAARTEHFHRLNQAVEAAKVDGVPLAAAMRRPEFTVEEFRRVLAGSGLGDIPTPIWATVHADRKYAAYIDRQHHEVRRAAEMEGKRLPDRIDYNLFTALRPEARQALARFRPSTFGQAGRLEGITPADLTLLAVLVKKHTAASR